MFVLDSHCDTPSEMLRGRDIGTESKTGHVDFPKLKAGGVDASFFALYTPVGMEPDSATSRALKMIGLVHDAIESNPGIAAFAASPKEIFENQSKGLISILFGMENGSPIQKSLSLLREFSRLGVRYMTLTHNEDNEIADAAAEGKRWNGLSPFGREVIDEMNRLGMIVDIAHASDKTFWDAVECSRTPIVSTHSCCRALAGHRRNMTDEMIRAMADKGGVIQINFYPLFLSDKAETEGATAEDVVRHIDHAVNAGGIEHVGIGTDFDGIETTPAGLEDISKLQVLFGLMSKKGYSDDQIELIAGKNFLRVFNDVISSALQ